MNCPNLGSQCGLTTSGADACALASCSSSSTERRVVGVTTNPSIFAAAVGDGAEYAEQLTTLASLDATPETAVRALTVADVSDACDVLAPVYEATKRVDGRVSLEVDPRLSGDTDATTRGGQGAVAGRQPAKPHGEDPGHAERAFPQSPRHWPQG